MKSVAFSHSGRVIDVQTQASVLQALLAERIPVQMACGGKGHCATCHVYLERGEGALTPRTRDLVGRRAEVRILHPVTGKLLVPEGKIITRSVIQKLSEAELDLNRVLQESRDA